MIVAVGIGVDETFAHFVRLTRLAGLPLKVLDLIPAVSGEWRLEVPAEAPGELRFGAEALSLDPRDAFYCRIIDLSSRQPDESQARRWRALCTGVRAWLETAPGRVVNRGEPAAHNRSKPLHEHVLRGIGFRVPESLTSSDARSLREFTASGATISKTVCGVRADAVLVGPDDFADFEPENGPVHVQRFVAGYDARIHVVGDRLVALRTGTTSVDYRREGALHTMRAFEPPPALRERLVEGTRELGLAFAGWDFKIDADETYWCLEVNPMPGYHPYDRACDGAITRQLWRFLTHDA